MQTTMFVIIFLTVDIVIIGGLFVALAMEWNAIANAFPSTEPAPNAIRRRFQSCSLGIFNLSWSTHITADDEHLHMHPTLFLRLCTNHSLSIPWEEIKPGKHHFFRKFRSFKIGKRTMLAPSWAVDLAEPIDE